VSRASGAAQAHSRARADRPPDACRTAADRLPDGVKPGFHGAGTHWIRDFVAFRLARPTPDREADGADVT